MASRLPIDEAPASFSGETGTPARRHHRMFRLDWNQERPSGPIRLVVSGELCEAAHEAIVAALERARQQAATVELDLSNVTRVDRSLVNCLAHLCVEGVTVTVSRCPAYLERWLREERATAGPDQANEDPCS